MTADEMADKLEATWRKFPGTITLSEQDEIVAMLRRLATAEAERDELQENLNEALADADRLAVMLQGRDDGIGIDWVDDEALMAHDEAVARRSAADGGGQ